MRGNGLQLPKAYNITIESIRALKLAIDYGLKIESLTPTLQSKTSEIRMLDIAIMEITLLHGKDCTVWEGKDPLTRKRLGSGKLKFAGFESFSVRTGEERPQIFKCKAKCILSGKISIEETENDAERKMEGKAEEKAAEVLDNGPGGL